MTQGEVEPAALDAGPKLKTFISYAREDMDLVDRLDGALKARGIQTLVDRSDIYAFEDWWQRIQALIVRADALVFVISPAAVASAVAQKEITFATSLSKRLAPIVASHVDAQTVPEVIGRLNWIDFTDPALFEARADQLAEALTTNIDWVRKHTEYGEIARRWSAAGRPGPRGLLLRSPALEEAERWIASRPVGAPPPTEETRTFVAESRRAATRRRNVLTGSFAAGFIVALGLAGLAYWQRGVALEERNRALLTQSRFLGDLASERTAGGDAATAMLFAIEGLTRSPDGIETTFDRPYSAEAERSLFDAYNALRERSTIDGGYGQLDISEFTADGRYLIVRDSAQSGDYRVWDVATGRQAEDRIKAALAVSPYRRPADRFSLNTSTGLLSDKTTARTVQLKELPPQSLLRDADVGGRRVVTSSSYLDKKRVWNALTGESIFEFDPELFTLSPNGRVLAMVTTEGRDWFAGRDTRQLSRITIRDLDSGAMIDIVYRDVVVKSLLLSPDGRRLIAGSEGGLQFWDLAHDMLADYAASPRSATDNDNRALGATRVLDIEMSPLLRREDGNWFPQQVTSIRVVDAKSHDVVAAIKVEPPKDLDDTRDATTVARGGKAWIVLTTEGKEERAWRAFGSREEIVRDAMSLVPRCLTQEQRSRAFLSPGPPGWCVEMGKWPYWTEDWKIWLAAKRRGRAPPFPGTVEWGEWVRNQP